MKALIVDPIASEEMIAKRRALGLDRRDEVWEGVWHMVPSPRLEHQRLEANLLLILKEVVERAGLGIVVHQFNVVDPVKKMADLRIPDLSVVLSGGRAQVSEAYIAGGPDLVIEIRSPGDETYEKLHWYAQQGVREVLVIDRDTESPELFRLQSQELVKVAGTADAVESQVVPLRFERVMHEGKPGLVGTYTADPAKRWQI